MKTIYCYGDSNTWGYDPRSFLGGRYPKDVRWTGILEARSGCRVVNDGVNGRRIPADPLQTEFLAQHLAECAQTGGETELFLLLGTNDLLEHPEDGAAYTAARMADFLGSLLRQPALKGLSAVPRIRLISPALLRRGSWVETDALVKQSHLLGAAMRAVAGRYGLDFTDAGELAIDLLFDGVHFSEAGHRTLAEALLQEL